MWEPSCLGSLIIITFIVKFLYLDFPHFLYPVVVCLFDIFMKRVLMISSPMSFRFSVDDLLVSSNLLVGTCLLSIQRSCQSLASVSLSSEARAYFCKRLDMFAPVYPCCTIGLGNGLSVLSGDFPIVWKSNAIFGKALPIIGAILSII